MHSNLEPKVSIFGKTKDNQLMRNSSKPSVPVALPPAKGSIISMGTKIKGDIKTTDHVQVDGELKGTMDVTNHVTIGKTGKVKANLKVRSLQVYGKLIGDVVAIERVTIEQSGSIEGNITSPKLAISEGAHFRGNIEMSRGENDPTGAASNKSQDEVNLNDNIELHGAVSSDA